MFLGVLETQKWKSSNEKILGNIRGLECQDQWDNDLIIQETILVSDLMIMAENCKKGERRQKNA